jgi:hypothetical protein
MYSYAYEDTVMERLPQDKLAKRKLEAKKIAEELKQSMDVTPEEWTADVRATRDGK